MSGSTSELAGIKKHEVYYIKGGDVYFLVEEWMFRVHSYFFERESYKFQQMFGGPTLLGVEPEGSSPDTAFRLSDITAEDFAHFLWIFYNPRPSACDASTDVWISVLRTACKWSFPEVKALAIKELKRRTITLVDPIVLYENYRDDPSVLALLYAKLCSRDRPPTMEQSMSLGIKTTVRIFHARERLRSSSLDRLNSPLPDDVDLADVIQVIDEIWEGDMKCVLGERDRVPILSTVATERQSEEQEKERARVAEEPMKSKAGAETATKPEEGKVIKETSHIPSGPTLAIPGPSVSAPRKSATATVPKIPSQLPSQSAWSKSPPQTASSSRSQSPAPQNTPALATHSRRPSTLGQGIHIKDGVSIPRNNVGATKQGPPVSFGSIDDASAPMSSSPTATPSIESEGVKTFGTVLATVSQVNGKSSVSIAKLGSSSNTSHKPRKQDLAKLFQNPLSAPPPQASSDTSSPNIRPSNLPPSSQPPSIPSSSHPPYSSFVPQNDMRPQQSNAGPNGGATGSGPRSPQYQRQVPNGNAPRIPSGPGGPGGPQMSAGLSSPRMTPHPPPTNMPPPMQTQMSWPPNYYYMGDQPYMYPWYPMQQHQMPPQPPQHHPQPPGGHGPPHNGIPVSPRNHPLPLQGPGTPTLTHAAPASHAPHMPPAMTHSSSGSIGGLSPPPPTLSSASMSETGRSNTSANAFVPGQRSSTRVSLENAEGQKINLEILKNQKLSPAQSGAALPPVVSPAYRSPNRRSIVRMESEEERSKRLAGEREKELTKAKAEADSKAKKEKEEKEKKEKEDRQRKEKEEKERLEKEAKEKKEREAKAAKEKQVLK